MVSQESLTRFYRKNFDEIFGKKEQDELKESYEQSLRNKKDRDGNKEDL